MDKWIFQYILKESDSCYKNKEFIKKIIIYIYCDGSTAQEQQIDLWFHAEVKTTTSEGKKITQTTPKRKNNQKFQKYSNVSHWMAPKK